MLLFTLVYCLQSTARPSWQRYEERYGWRRSGQKASTRCESGRWGAPIETIYAAILIVVNSILDHPRRRNTPGLGA